MLYSKNLLCFSASQCDCVARLRQYVDDRCESVLLLLLFQTVPRSAGGWAGRARRTCTGAARCRAVSSAPVACRRTACIPNTSATVTQTAKNGMAQTPSHITTPHHIRIRHCKENEACFQEH